MPFHCCQMHGQKASGHLTRQKHYRLTYTKLPTKAPGALPMDEMDGRNITSWVMYPILPTGKLPLRHWNMPMTIFAATSWQKRAATIFMRIYLPGKCSTTVMYLILPQVL